MRLPDGVTDDEFTKLYAKALAHAKRRTAKMPDEMQLVAHDAATDGLLWAAKNYDPARVNPDTEQGFAAFAMAAVQRFVWRQVEKQAKRHARNPVVGSLTTDEGEDFPVHDPRGGAGWGVELPIEVADALPKELADAVRLFYVDRFDMRQCALLLGVVQSTVRDRLIRAAKLLGDGEEQPTRKAGSRRLVC